MEVTVIPIVIGALGTVTKGLVQRPEIRRRVETVQTRALVRSARILKVLETCRHSQTSGKQLPNAGVENSQMSKMI